MQPIVYKSNASEENKNPNSNSESSKSRNSIQHLRKKNSFQHLPSTTPKNQIPLHIRYIEEKCHIFTHLHQYHVTLYLLQLNDTHFKEHLNYQNLRKNSQTQFRIHFRNPLQLTTKANTFNTGSKIQQLQRVKQLKNKHKNVIPQYPLQDSQLYCKTLKPS